MRQIKEQTEDGEKTILVFQSPEERSEFFSRSEKMVKEKQIQGVADVLRAYRQAVAAIDEAFRISLGELRELEGASRLESEIPDRDPAA